MFDIAPQVIRWHADGQDAVLARVVSVTGLRSDSPSQAVALSSNHQMAGAVLASVTDPQLLPVLTQVLTALQPAQPPGDHTDQNPHAPATAPQRPLSTS